MALVEHTRHVQQDMEEAIQVQQLPKRLVRVQSPLVLKQAQDQAKLHQFFPQVHIQFISLHKVLKRPFLPTQRYKVLAKSIQYD